MLNTVLGSLSSGVAASTSSYESIASATGTGSSGTITFSSIPSTYKHLQIRLLGRSDATGGTTISASIRCNGDTGTNYARHTLSGDGATVTASADAPSASQLTLFRITTNGAAANIMGVGIVDIIDYASTTKYKTLRSITGLDENGTGTVRLQSGLWQNTAAINTIDVFIGSNFLTSTVVSLYGIKGA